MASVIWPDERVKQVYKVLTGRYKNNVHVNYRPQNAVIIAKGNIFEGIEAKQ